MSLPEFQILRKPRINLEVEALKETVSLLPIETGDALFRLTSLPTYNRLLVNSSDGSSAKDRENLPAFSQLEMNNYIRELTGDKLFPDDPAGFIGLATIATANSTTGGALAEALRVYYEKESKYKVFVCKTLLPDGTTAYGSPTDNKPGNNVTQLQPIVLEDLSYDPYNPHRTALFSNYVSIANEYLQKTGGVKADYFCGYGCITIPQSADHKHKLWTFREEWQTRISLVNMLIALRTLKVGGNFCNKIQDGHSRISLDLARITAPLFERVVFYEPPSMGWIGRRYIIGLEFKGFVTQKEEKAYFAWLESLVQQYEKPLGVPLTLLTERPKDPERQQDWDTLKKGWEDAMEACDQVIIQDFKAMFQLIVDLKPYLERNNEDGCKTKLEQVFRINLSNAYKEIDKSLWEYGNHLKVVSGIGKIKMPPHMKDHVWKNRILLLAMATNEVIWNWLEGPLIKLEVCTDNTC